MNFLFVLLLSALIKSSLSCLSAPTKKPTPASQYNAPAPPTATVSTCGHSIYYNTGETFGAGIVGGLDAKRHEFPWQVRLRITSGMNTLICGATLINTRWIVTAAHCAKGASGPESITAVFGDHDRSTTETGEVAVGISKIVIHPNYNQSSANPNDYDITMLQLQNPIAYSNTTQPICLPVNCEKSACQESSPAWITGWGTDEEGSASGVSILQKAWLPVISKAKCSSAYSTIYTTITDNMMCAGFDEGGVDTCQGDSGGPLICNNAGFWELGGVTSFGHGCARKGFYGVYAKACVFVDWIKTTSAITY